jgi:hypothetical protein
MHENISELNRSDLNRAARWWAGRTGSPRRSDAGGEVNTTFFSLLASCGMHQIDPLGDLLTSSVFCRNGPGTVSSSSRYATVRSPTARWSFPAMMLKTMTSVPAAATLS